MATKLRAKNNETTINKFVAEPDGSSPCAIGRLFEIIGYAVPATYGSSADDISF